MEEDPPAVTRKMYTAEFKAQLVAEVNAGKPMKEVAEANNVIPGNLDRWVRQARRAAGDPAPKPKPKPKPKAKPKPKPAEPSIESIQLRDMTDTLKSLRSSYEELRRERDELKVRVQELVKANQTYATQWNAMKAEGSHGPSPTELHERDETIKALKRAVQIFARDITL